MKKRLQLLIKSKIFWISLVVIALISIIFWLYLTYWKQGSARGHDTQVVYDSTKREQIKDSIDIFQLQDSSQIVESKEQVLSNHLKAFFDPSSGIGWPLVIGIIAFIILVISWFSDQYKTIKIWKRTPRIRNIDFTLVTMERYFAAILLFVALFWALNSKQIILVPEVKERLEIIEKPDPRADSLIRVHAARASECQNQILVKDLRIDSLKALLVAHQPTVTNYVDSAALKNMKSKIDSLTAALSIRPPAPIKKTDSTIAKKKPLVSAKSKKKKLIIPQYYSTSKNRDLENAGKKAYNDFVKKKKCN